MGLNFFSKKKEISYELFLWSSFTCICVLAILERFLLNLTPDGQVDSAAIKNAVDTNERTLIPFMIIVPATARLIVISICLFFFTMTRVLHNYIVEWADYIPGVDFSDAANVIFRGHKLYGIFFFTSILVLHIIFAFSPGMHRARDLVITDEVFEPFFPAEFRRIEFTHFVGKWAMRRDDIFDASLALFVTLILQPITILYSPFRMSYYELSFALHIVGALVMLWLVYRIPEHIRIFTYGTPFVVAWAVDRFMHDFWFRLRASEVKFIDLDADYSVMLFQVQHQRAVNIGDVYLLKTSQAPVEFSHPYTCFQFRLPGSSVTTSTAATATNTTSVAATSIAVTSTTVAEVKLPLSSPSHHTAVQHVAFHTAAISTANNKLSVESAAALRKERSYLSQSLADNSNHNNSSSSNNNNDNNCTQQQQQTYGCIVRNFKGKSFSGKLLSEFGIGGKEEFYAIGPYRRIYRRLMRIPQLCPYVLVGTGSGCSYIMDFMYWLRANNVTALPFPVYIHASTHSLALLDFLADTLLRHGDTENLFIHLHITSHHLENAETFIAPSTAAADDDDNGEQQSLSAGRSSLRSISNAFSALSRLSGAMSNLSASAASNKKFSAKTVYVQSIQESGATAATTAATEAATAAGEEGEEHVATAGLTFTNLQQLQQEFAKRGFASSYNARSVRSHASGSRRDVNLTAAAAATTTTAGVAQALPEDEEVGFQSSPAAATVATAVGGVSAKPAMLLRRNVAQSQKQQHVAVGLKRMNLDNIFQQAAPNSEVYFCGAGAVLKAVQTKCKQYQLPLYHEEPYV